MIALLLAFHCLAGTGQVPAAGQTHLAVDELRDHLSGAPLFSLKDPSPITIVLPGPGGEQLTCQVWRDPVLSDELRSAHPEFQTYALQGVAGKYSGRLLVSPAGLDGVIIEQDQVLFIEPVDPAGDLHRIYYWKPGSNFLSFATDQERIDLSADALRLAVLTDASYGSYHEEQLTRAVLASVNGVNAFLQISQGIRLQLHYLGGVDDEQVLDCRRNGFRGRAAESLKLFGDLIARGDLRLEDFDLGHLFSGRGFGSTTLPAVAGSNTYYDWNEDGVFDGPAKTAGGTGAVMPEGSTWWGNLCNGLSRQLKSSELVQQILRAAEQRTRSAETEPTAALLTSGRAALVNRPFDGLGLNQQPDFSYLACLPYPEPTLFDNLLRPVSVASRNVLTGLRSGSSNNALPWLLFFSQTQSEVFRKEWSRYWNGRE